MAMYEVSWDIRLTRLIEASTKAEAVCISEDMGDAGVENDPSPDYHVFPMKAKLATRGYEVTGGEVSYGPADPGN